MGQNLQRKNRFYSDELRKQCDQIGAIYWTLGKIFKPLETINLPKSPTFLGNFFKGVKIFIFLVKSFLGNFY